jgi:hypothetical protein
LGCSGQRSLGIYEGKTHFVDSTDDDKVLRFVRKMDADNFIKVLGNLGLKGVENLSAQQDSMEC